MNIRSSIYIFLSILIFQVNGIFRTNVLQPYNIFLQPDPRNETRFSFQFGYEGICSTHAFTPRVDGSSNVLQIFQCTQDAIAAFKGFAPETDAGQYAQIFDINDDNTTHGIFTPHAKLIIPLNGMLGIQGRIAHNVWLHAYVPFLYAELSDICWREHNDHVEFENNNFPQLLQTVGKVGCLDLFNGWKRLGFGDTVVFVKWQQNFWQMKPVLRNVRLSFRGGLNFPTGKKEDISKLLALPFGWDQGYGVYFAGNLNLFMNYDWRFMVDLEFLQLFGNTKTRRIKTDIAQTDLLLIARDCVYVDPGFTQQYSFMLEKRSIYQGLSGALLYQYLPNNKFW